MSKKNQNLNREILNLLGVPTKKLTKATITLIPHENVKIEATYIRRGKDLQEYENPLTIKHFELKEIKEQ